MRALGYSLSIALAFGLLIFFWTNQDALISVDLPWANYPQAALWKIVLVAVATGVLFTGIFAVAEGAHTRLTNRRLRREIHKLETEINYLRTQPSSSGLSDPVEAAPRSRSLAAPTRSESTGQPPSRPIYGAESDDPAPDTEDDMYTGGRAV